jgi:hypothetical protein
VGATLLTLSVLGSVSQTAIGAVRPGSPEEVAP